MSRFDPVIGVWKVARGRAEGMARFGDTTQSFLASLAPLIAFPVAGALLELVSDGLVPALGLLAVTIIAQLAPPVLSHVLAVRWQREHAWLHYATAYNWCYWAIPVVAALLMTLFGMGLRAGLPAETAVQAFFLSLAAYSLWLHWFLARHGLALSVWRAILLVVLVNAGTLLLAFGPRLLA
ncbi:MAG TPA: hypothetical protein VE650_00635 [Acetobacteraceae bacterium]|nr:hypothetical protein [Acetobacteraceae bacterium]